MEDRMVETNEAERKKERRIFKNEDNLREFWDNVIRPNILIVGVQELEKISFHSDPKERQCQRMLKLPHNCTHLTG